MPAVGGAARLEELLGGALTALPAPLHSPGPLLVELRLEKAGDSPGGEIVSLAQLLLRRGLATASQAGGGASSSTL